MTPTTERTTWTGSRRVLFEGFVTKSGDALLRMATLLTADPDAAEGVYQETLHRLAMRWSPVDSPRAFCRRVMHNLVIDQARARKRRPRELFAEHDPGDPPGRRQGHRSVPVGYQPRHRAAEPYRR
jgi:DNA-directed RNA polymerase specialized sigma24 family protein